ncbi:MAG TPA: winged helix-turn-helix transcriptional regulator [Actinomycetota bacterium]|jgi:DNA-binding HxlR family transcriptional regulator/putative sterol carrier protein
MSEHGYRQFCALARALDVVGNRWTLLIVRELRPGPRRFTDLVDGLPGISRKLLSERLRDLERAGVIARKELPRPAARQVYELTDDGRDLSRAMAPLIAWGAGRIGERRSGESFRPRWVAVAMAELADRAAATGVHEAYQYVVDEDAFHFTIDDGSIELSDGMARDPAVVVTTDERTWADIASGKTTTSTAAADGALTIAGDRRAWRRLTKIFSRWHMLSKPHARAGHAGARE